MNNIITYFCINTQKIGIRSVYRKRQAMKKTKWVNFGLHSRVAYQKFANEFLTEKIKFRWFARCFVQITIKGLEPLQALYQCSGVRIASKILKATPFGKKYFVKKQKNPIRVRFLHPLINHHESSKGEGQTAKEKGGGLVLKKPFISIFLYQAWRFSTESNEVSARCGIEKYTNRSEFDFYHEHSPSFGTRAFLENKESDVDRWAWPTSLMQL